MTARHQDALDASSAVLLYAAGQLEDRNGGSAKRDGHPHIRYEGTDRLVRRAHRGVAQADLSPPAEVVVHPTLVLRRIVGPGVAVGAVRLRNRAPSTPTTIAKFTACGAPPACVHAAAAAASAASADAVDGLLRNALLGLAAFFAVVTL